MTSDRMGLLRPLDFTVRDLKGCVGACVVPKRGAQALLRWAAAAVDGSWEKGREEAGNTSYFFAFLQQALQPLRCSLSWPLISFSLILSLIIVFVQTQLKGNSYQGGH